MQNGEWGKTSCLVWVSMIWIQIRKELHQWYWICHFRWAQWCSWSVYRRGLEYARDCRTWSWWFVIDVLSWLYNNLLRYNQSKFQDNCFSLSQPKEYKHLRKSLGCEFSISRVIRYSTCIIFRLQSVLA